MTPSLQSISLVDIQVSRANPRHDPGADLNGLAASIGTSDAPSMVQPPILEQTGDQAYAVIAGERRILAARQAGWQTILCIVHPHLDPLHAHTLRLVENLHRKDLHPLDEAIGLRIAWLSANAEEIGLGDSARAVLMQAVSPCQTLVNLQSLMDANNFSPNHPIITWDAFLSRLGLDLDPERRKKLLAVLNIDVGLQEKVRSLDVTEAALRSIGTLDAECQKRLVAELAEDHGLARKVRRIARVVRDGTYTLDEALAEAHGIAPAEIMDDPSMDVPDEEVSVEPARNDELLLDDRPMSAAMELLEIANRLNTATRTLLEVSQGDMAALPQPWGEYAREALNMIETEIRKLAPDQKGG